ncbi:MAG: SRPBCC domain-containing protein [Phycisphaerales bacterium]|nr:SRPBCC domain-containing protein [Phycisphaerales bacterium]MCI0629766.1 SRPBCC domain-containing protein [Phycisphaerales bacterium]MCI0676501.1 SRPBCC domain-containing protein [Phycisphaerales bacterium]
MSDRTFVYAVHIATTPEKLWQALTRNEFWQEYWNGEWRVESTWKSGSPVKFFNGDGTFFSEGKVIASDPPKSLTYTWPSPPEDQGSAPPEPERLTWQIKPTGPSAVMLKLIHECLSEKYYQSVGEGWPAILSSLKSLLETGQPLKFFPRSAS